MRTRNIAIFLILILVIIAIAFYFFGRPHNRPMTKNLTWDHTEEPNKIRIVGLTTERKNIFRLELLITGEIIGNGKLSIGVTDSTAYKEYELKEGPINIEYVGDWYSSSCVVTYKSITSTRGRLKIKADFGNGIE